MATEREVKLNFERHIAELLKVAGYTAIQLRDSSYFPMHMQKIYGKYSALLFRNRESSS